MKIKKINQNGFTLIELVLVIVLLGIISTVAGRILIEGFKGYLTNKNIVDANWQAQTALERMTRELRSIRSPADITTSTASQISFIDTNNSTITYSLSGTNLMRNSQILADGMGSLLFNYYDQNGTATATPSNMHFIKISFSITKNNTNYSLGTAVFIRN